MIEWLIAPFRFGFMQTALLAAILIGLACASIGAYVVWRGWRSSAMLWRTPSCPA